MRIKARVMLVPTKPGHKAHQIPPQERVNHPKLANCRRNRSKPHGEHTLADLSMEPAAVPRLEESVKASLSQTARAIGSLDVPWRKDSVMRYSPFVGLWCGP